MRSRCLVIEILSVLLLIRNSEVHAECNLCQKNSAACVNETAFNLCFGDNTPHTSQTFNCISGLVCTDLPNICYQIGSSAALAPSCEKVSKCGACNDKKVFACTSRTTFAFCFGSASASDVVGSCPTGYVCDLSSNEICVPKDLASSVACDIDAVKSNSVIGKWGHQ